MNREILFRGHTNAAYKEWVYGAYCYDQKYDISYILKYNGVTKSKGLIGDCNSKYAVITETVGRLYTGLEYKKDGSKMFEGDMFRRYNSLYVIKVNDFHGYRFVVELADGSGHGADTLTKADAEYGEYVGNIHDNPELISKKHE